MAENEIRIGDNLPILEWLPENSVDLIYIDPPFNTRKKQTRTQIKTRHSENGDRLGFNGNRYETTVIGTKAYEDYFDDYLVGFLKPRLQEAHRILASQGTIYFHIDYREVHRCKIMLDEIFKVFDSKGGRFLGEIIWAYDYGGRSKKKWAAKHDNILVYAKGKNPYFNNDFASTKIRYKAPGTGGKLVPILPTDTWWHTIVPTNSKEKTGYPTQKPLGLLNRIIQTSSREGALVLDFFAGSGTTGESCRKLGRRFILIDDNPEAGEVMRKRFADDPSIEWIPHGSR